MQPGAKLIIYETGEVGAVCYIASAYCPGSDLARWLKKRDQPVPPRTNGEICLKSPTIMAGYWQDPKATDEAMQDGWLHTGDIGYLDDDGYLFITDRKKDLIIKGGENIAPREIDEALLRHPAVLEGAAAGVPDPDYGQEIFACVVVKPGAALDEAELRAHCERELGRYKAPRYLRFVAELPKGPSGKVQRLRLAELWQSPGP